MDPVTPPRRPLPWWTWILPALIAHAGTRLSLITVIAPGVSASYLPIPLGIAMAIWWGPRAIVGIYVNAVLSAGLWNLPDATRWPLYALPEAIAVAAGWWLFDKVGKGRAWLPALNDAVKFVLLAVIPAAALNAFLVAGGLVWFADLLSLDFWRASWSGGIATLMDGLAVGAALGVFVTPWLERRGWSRTQGAAASQSWGLLDVGWGACIEMTAVFAAALALSLFLPLERYWSAYGVFAVWAALRQGAGLAVLANLWIEILTIFVPAYAMAHVPVIPNAEIQNLQTALTLICLVGLVVGRTISDQREEIAQRLQAERTVAQNEEKLRLIIREQTEFVVKWLPDGTRTFVNESYCRYFGVTEQECIGTTFFPQIVPEHREMIRQKIEGLTPDQPERTSEHRSFAANGEERWQLWTDRGFFDANGHLVELLSTGRDVTERRKAEEALREVASRYRAILESSIDGLIVANERAEILEFNAAAEAIFGRRREHVVGLRVADVVIPPQLRESHEHGLARFLSTGTAKMIGRRVELPALKADGSEFQVELTISVVPGTDPPVFAAVVRDISQRLQLEERLRQAQRMEAVGRLAGGIAHDFNNLVMVIAGYSDLVLQNLPAGDPRRSMVEQIHRAGNRSAELTRQLLAFSRQQVLAPRVVDLNEIVRDVDRMLRRVIGEDVTLDATLQPGLGLIYADPGQIEQVLLNLAVNARDAMPQGGTLSIVTSRDDAFKTADKPAAPHALLSISDTGTGMSPDVQRRVFEPFFTTKGAGKGTGLGLSVVHGIVEQSGGHIEVSSVEGTGTTFRIHLPIVDQAPEASIAAATSAASGGSERILVVEDEGPLRSLITQVLRRYGYTVLEAANGEEALALATRDHDRIWLLITDVVMPGMSGRVVAERLSAIHPEAKVLYLSGYTDDAVIRHGVLHEQVNFLQKPFSLDALTAKVAEVLAKT